MNALPNHLAAIESDWDRHNLLALQSCLRSAYAAVAERTDPERDPLFDNPNRTFMAGILRWSVVDQYLWRGCDSGIIRGITPVWLPLNDGTGGIYALELRGQRTSVLAHHLQQPDDSPRDSKLRIEKRLLNQQSPLLPGLADEPQPDAPLLNLLLVHGDKRAEFAYLRAYHSLSDPRAFLSVSENIMAMSTAERGAAEEVPELELGLKFDPAPQRRQTAS